eukprot:scaffold1582_cov318-Pavlova_lutheri.AAC.1
MARFPDAHFLHRLAGNPTGVDPSFPSPEVHDRIHLDRPWIARGRGSMRTRRGWGRVSCAGLNPSSLGFETGGRFLSQR